MAFGSSCGNKSYIKIIKETVLKINGFREK